ncbi:MAG UNVERIFIED_CONTAM: hypothetical protein LVT10_14770 [Anaerolineae bacterium]
MTDALDVDAVDTRFYPCQRQAFWQFKQAWTSSRLETACGHPDGRQPLLDGLVGSVERGDVEHPTD